MAENKRLEIEDQRPEYEVCVCVCCDLFAVSCVVRVGTQTAFDEYLQRGWSGIKSSRLARCLILSLALWEFWPLLVEGVGVGVVGGPRGVYPGS